MKCSIVYLMVIAVLMVMLVYVYSVNNDTKELTKNSTGKVICVPSDRIPVNQYFFIMHTIIIVILISTVVWQKRNFDHLKEKNCIK